MNEDRPAQPIHFSGEGVPLLPTPKGKKSKALWKALSQLAEPVGNGTERDPRPSLQEIAQPTGNEEPK